VDYNLNPDLLYFIEGDSVVRAIVKLGGAGTLVAVMAWAFSSEPPLLRYAVIPVARKA
jgi:hypothetical protein